MTSSRIRCARSRVFTVESTQPGRSRRSTKIGLGQGADPRQTTVDDDCRHRDDSVPVGRASRTRRPRRACGRGSERLRRAAQPICHQDGLAGTVRAGRGYVDLERNVASPAALRGAGERRSARASSSARPASAIAPTRVVSSKPPRQPEVRRCCPPTVVRRPFPPARLVSLTVQHRPGSERPADLFDERASQLHRVELSCRRPRARSWPRRLRAQLEPAPRTSCSSPARSAADRPPARARREPSRGEQSPSFRRGRRGTAAGRSRPTP